MSEPVSDFVAMQTAGHTVLQLPGPDPLEKMLRAHLRTFEPRQFVVMEGETTGAVLCVLDGWLSLSKCLPDGETQIVDLALPGEIIETGAAQGSVSPVSIEALANATVATIPAPSWEDMKRQRPDLARISRDIRAAARARAAGRMLRLGRGRAVMRLAYALLELNVRLAAIGQSKDGRFDIPMNQRVLGDFVGLTSVHVCRILRQLAGNGIIRVEGHMTIEILNPDHLAELAGVDLNSLPCEILADSDCRRTGAAHPARA